MPYSISFFFLAELAGTIAFACSGAMTAIEKKLDLLGVIVLGVTTAAELAQVIAAVGLAQNFAALRALATDGIQKGHMKLHARNLATVAGATADQLDAVVAKMVTDKKISVDYAKEILAGM